MKAGIIAFQNEQYYYLLSVAGVAGRTVVQLEKHAGPQTGAAGVIVSFVPARHDHRTMIADAKTHLEPRA